MNVPLPQQLSEAERAFRAGQPQTAEGMLRRILVRDPAVPKAYELLAYIYGNRGELDACEDHLSKAAALPGCAPEVLFYLGRVQLQRGRAALAVQSFEQCITRSGEHFEVLHEWGVALRTLGRNEAALAVFLRAERKQARSIELQLNLGDCLGEMRRLSQALVHYERALSLDRHLARAWWSRSGVLSLLGRRQDALDGYETLERIAPETEYLRGAALHERMHLCQWDDWQMQVEALIDRVDQGERASAPLPMLSTPAGPATQLRAARAYMQDHCPADRTATIFPARPQGGRLRIGYFSADFRDHAVAHLTARLFECHDRSRFEWFGFAIGRNPPDAMTARIAASFDHFQEAGDLDDDQLVRMAREAGLDIAVDLNGLTGEERISIFARRVAPIQVNYLGYAGSTGCSFMDYVIADATVIPPEDSAHYDEKVVLLPDSFQVNDDTKPIASVLADRASFGLPAEGFVFACFNNSFKITPDVFDIWMRLLLQVPGSVLWLFKGNDASRASLWREAARRGVAAERLVWAERMPQMAVHLARHAHADLFLDTFYYNAHTTASDALWAGLPVLTMAGTTFASRVSASLLRAVGLPELVTDSPDGYERVALELAWSPPALAALRKRLVQSRDTSPLFDTPLFARRIEAAFEAMWARHCAGLAPDHLDMRGIGVGAAMRGAMDATDG